MPKKKPAGNATVDSASCDGAPRLLADGTWNCPCGDSPADNPHDAGHPSRV